MSNEAATSIVKNTSVMMASQVVTWISSFVLILFLPRFLGSEDYGRLYLAISLTMIFQIVIDFGGPYYIAKEISRSRSEAPSLVVNSIALRGTLWLLSIGVLVVVSLLAGYSPLVTTLIFVLGIAKLWEGAGRVFNSCFQGFEMMQYPSLGAIVERTFIMLAGVIALFLGAHSLLIAALMAFSTLLNFSVTARCARRIIPSLPKVQWSVTRGLLKSGIPYFLWSVFAVVYYRIDAVMLSLMTSDSVVGWYGAAYRLFDVFMFLPSIVSWAMFPVLARLQKEAGSDLVRVTRKGLDFILLAGIPISIGVFAFSREVISLFFGLREYEPSIVLLQVFSVGIVLVYVDFILGTTLFASDKQRQWTGVAFGALLLNPALNYFFIPYTQLHGGNGGIGAAIATLLTELFVMVMALLILPRGVLNGARVGVQLKGIAAGAFMGVTVWFLRISEIPWMLQGVLAMGIYLTALFTLRTFSEAELGFIQRFFSLQNLRKTFVPNRGASA